MVHMANMPPAAPIIANVATAIPSPKAASLPVLEEPKSLETAFVPIRGFIWFKFAIQTSPDIQETIICRDSGIGHNLVDQEWLKQFEYIIEQRYGNNVSGFNGHITKLYEHATWMFYIQDITKDDNTTLVKMTTKAWVVDSLEANCLLGNM